MKFSIKIGKSANYDLQYYEKFQQRIIAQAILEYLTVDANIETRKRKKLRPNLVAPWELKIGKYMAFYEIIESQFVKVLAI